MLKIWITALALLLTLQITSMDRDMEFARKNPKGKALIDAATKGDIEQAQILIHEGVNVNTKDPHKNTALFYAAANGHEELCKLLISKEAHTTCACDDRPIWRVIITTNSVHIVQNFKIAELLLNPHNLPTKKACSQAIITFLYCLKKNKLGNEINLLFSNHWKTLLKPHFASSLRITPDINQKNGFGQTALMEVANSGTLNACEWLMQHGADVNIQTITPCGTHTALSIARGAQQYAKTSLGKDRSAASTYADYTKICELLLANGAIE